jgi:nucleoside phosphorylase
MFKTFRNIRMAVLVGIGGGIPRPLVSEDSLENVHLGDVVVGWPGDGKPACVYHDRGKVKAGEPFEMVGTMQNPDWRLTSALSLLVSDHELGRTTFDSQLARLQHHNDNNNKKKRKNMFAHPGVEHDRLFKPAYHHNGDYDPMCTACDQSELVQRPQRTEEDKYTIVFHRGRIATGNAVIRDGELRDEISVRCEGAICVEMEAAGVDVNRQCLVIRGISDYADSHKSDLWRSYAAGNAAAFARELLCRVAVSAAPAEPVQEPTMSSGIPSHSGPTTDNLRSAKHAQAPAPAPQTPRAGSETIVKVPKSSTTWSSAEDDMLLHLVQTEKVSKWKLVAQHFHRNEWACQKRYEKLARCSTDL